MLLDVPLKADFPLIVTDRFQPGFLEELRLGEDRSGTPNFKATQISHVMQDPAMLLPWGHGLAA